LVAPRRSTPHPRRRPGSILPIRRHLGRDTLVVGQTALALVLLVGSALLEGSFDRLRTLIPE
jgi:hypothetical protein